MSKKGPPSIMIGGTAYYFAGPGVPKPSSKPTERALPSRRLREPLVRAADIGDNITTVPPPQPLERAISTPLGPVPVFHTVPGCSSGGIGWSERNAMRPSSVMVRAPPPHPCERQCASVNSMIPLPPPPCPPPEFPPYGRSFTYHHTSHSTQYFTAVPSTAGVMRPPPTPQQFFFGGMHPPIPIQPDGAIPSTSQAKDSEHPPFVGPCEKDGEDSSDCEIQPSEEPSGKVSPDPSGKVSPDPEQEVAIVEEIPPEDADRKVFSEEACSVNLEEEDYYRFTSFSIKIEETMEYGRLRRVEVGHCCDSKDDLRKLGIHYPKEQYANICYGTWDGLVSIILDEAYGFFDEFRLCVFSECDLKGAEIVNGKLIPRKNKKKQDGKLVRIKRKLMKALEVNYEKDLPIRVIRSLRSREEFRPTESKYRYDGLYKIISPTTEPDPPGFVVHTSEKPEYYTKHKSCTTHRMIDNYITVNNYIRRRYCPAVYRPLPNNSASCNSTTPNAVKIDRSNSVAPLIKPKEEKFHNCLLNLTLMDIFQFMHTNHSNVCFCHKNLLPGDLVSFLNFVWENRTGYTYMRLPAVLRENAESIIKKVIKNVLKHSINANAKTTTTVEETTTRSIEDGGNVVETKLTKKRYTQYELHMKHFNDIQGEERLAVNEPRKLRKKDRIEYKKVHEYGIGDLMTPRYNLRSSLTGDKPIRIRFNQLAIEDIQPEPGPSGLLAIEDKPCQPGPSGLLAIEDSPAKKRKGCMPQKTPRKKPKQLLTNDASGPSTSQSPATKRRKPPSKNVPSKKKSFVGSEEEKPDDIVNGKFLGFTAESLKNYSDMRKKLFAQYPSFCNDAYLKFCAEVLG